MEHCVVIPDIFLDSFLIQKLRQGGGIDKHKRPRVPVDEPGGRRANDPVGEFMGTNRRLRCRDSSRVRLRLDRRRRQLGKRVSPRAAGSRR